MLQGLLQELAEFIQTVGFPVFVAVYVLLRLEPVISKLDKTIRVQTIIIAKLSGMSVDEVQKEYGFKPEQEG